MIVGRVGVIIIGSVYYVWCIFAYCVLLVSTMYCVLCTVQRVTGSEG